MKWSEWTWIAILASSSWGISNVQSQDPAPLPLRSLEDKQLSRKSLPDQTLLAPNVLDDPLFKRIHDEVKGAFPKEGMKAFLPIPGEANATDELVTLQCRENWLKSARLICRGSAVGNNDPAKSQKLQVVVKNLRLLAKSPPSQWSNVNEKPIAPELDSASVPRRPERSGVMADEANEDLWLACELMLRSAVELKTISQGAPKDNHESIQAAIRWLQTNAMDVMNIIED